MLRSLLILTVVASLVWCPVHCLAGVEPSVSTATEKSAPRKCSCCRHRTDAAETASPKSSAPTERSGDCDCSNCLCEGAVLGSDVPVDAFVAITSLNVVATDAFEISVAPLIDGGLLEVPIRSAPSGREIVVLYGNLRR